MAMYNSIFTGGEIDKGVGRSYVPTLQSAPTTSTLTFTLDGNTIDFEIGHMARVADQNEATGYKFYQLHDITESSNVKTAHWEEAGSGTLPNNIALLENTDSTAYSPDFDAETDTVHVTAQSLTTAQKTQARTNIGAADANTAVNSAVIRNIVTISQADYDALSSKDNNTLYIIV